MAKTTAPLLSFGASGQLGKTVVAAKWKGVPYMRQHVIPANPRTSSQTTSRSIFALLQRIWQLSPTLLQNPWDAATKGKPLIPRNLWTKANRPVLTGEMDLSNLAGSIGALGGFPPTAIVAAPTANPGEILVTITPPDAGDIPVGWTIASVVAWAITDQDPSADYVGPQVAGSANADPWQVTLTGLTTGSLTHVSGWVTYTKPNADIAYGPSLQTSATPV